MTDQNASNSEAPNSEAPNARVRDGKRGPTLCDKIIKERGKVEKVTVQFNKLGQVTGFPSFQSFLGSLARAHIPITIEDWGAVSDDLKYSLWETTYVSIVTYNIFLGRIQPFLLNTQLFFQETFNIPLDAHDLVLESLNKKWRDFKSKLVSDIIVPFLNEEAYRLKNPDALQTPPPKREIPVPVWREFVAMKTTPEARVTHFLIYRSIDQNIIKCNYLTIGIM